MQKVAKNIGNVVKNVRQGMGVSLDKAAALTGVSKAMLGQIERGESVPTISTLWKISSGLNISFSRLLGEDQAAPAVKPLSDIAPIFEDDGRMALYSIFPFSPTSGFDYLYIELQPGCRYQSPSHPNVVTEYVLVTDGVLELTVGDQVLRLGPGDSTQFRGDTRHTYANPGSTQTVIQNIMRY